MKALRSDAPTVSPLESSYNNTVNNSLWPVCRSGLHLCLWLHFYLHPYIFFFCVCLSPQRVGSLPESCSARRFFPLGIFFLKNFPGLCHFMLALEGSAGFLFDCGSASRCLRLFRECCGQDHTNREEDIVETSQCPRTRRLRPRQDQDCQVPSFLFQVCLHRNGTATLYFSKASLNHFQKNCFASSIHPSC